MRRISKKRRAENIEYLQAIKELDEEWKENGWWTCLFSGEPLGSKPDHHHLVSRLNSSIYDKSKIGIVKRKWHTAWHNEPIKKLMSYEWWEGFQARLKERCPEAYEHVMNEIENRLSRS